MTYENSKNKLNAIRNSMDYRCSGELIFRTALLYVIECGQQSFQNENWLMAQVDEVYTRHNIAEQEGKCLIMTRDFEIAILKCAKDIAEINAMDLVMYLQREIWFGNDISYERATELLRNYLSFAIDDTYEMEYALEEARDVGFNDDEIEELGFGCMFDVMEEE